MEVKHFSGEGLAPKSQLVRTMRACVRACACACVREREKMGRRLKEGLLDEEGVSERVREREREGGRGRERDFFPNRTHVSLLPLVLWVAHTSNRRA